MHAECMKFSILSGEVDGCSLFLDFADAEMILLGPKAVPRKELARQI